MIKLDHQNVRAERVGQEFGLDLDSSFAQYKEQIGKIVTDLYANKDNSGAWTRWLSLGDNQQLADELTAYAEEAKGKFSDMVVLGIGGSSLGGYALLRALRHPYWNQLSDEQRG
ncbi:MAG: hypothetical protein JW902_06505, partial [Syntrophaceae bacterium]|nr:hypothetical protein [Syntrophaceae bacterium]